METTAAPSQFRPVAYDLDSILHTIDLRTLFPAMQPLEIELGAGDGSFIAPYAAHHPERNFIATERLLGRLRKIERKAQRAGLVNTRAVRIESSYFLRYLLPPGAAAALHIYFPDPWPKRKHANQRLINESFPQLAGQALARGGEVFVRTDDEPYYRQILDVFAKAPNFVPLETPKELIDIKTGFEKDFLKRGIPTQYAAYRKI